MRDGNFTNASGQWDTVCNKVKLVAHRIIITLVVTTVVGWLAACKKALCFCFVFSVWTCFHEHFGFLQQCKKVHWVWSTGDSKLTTDVNVNGCFCVLALQGAAFCPACTRFFPYVSNEDKLNLSQSIIIQVCSPHQLSETL